MANVAKIACSIDADLLAQVETLRSKTGETRSAFISRALAALTHETSLAREVRRYVDAYREHPEGSEEVRSARKIARRTLRHLPWRGS